ncbi:prephenate dehydrogenase [Sphingobium sp. DEHP117]|uniref:prephenate dehydrogenase/arogenate dehydrogenase family protein n=1 Tax=Sphingobium sp. DEHP117 TaxID=2993436 RepID=UPI0027D60DF6|nr:prephenate dehydrogenase/arogenate dehydrogenase family protein [Sphingobium sp. DEHP117]MDQ4420583.1 prephenate dehydrogenase [Sphingobium sp. DEHP117]
MKTLGIIGFGDFGRLAAAHLGARFIVGAYDAHLSAAAIAAHGARALGFAEAAQCDVVMIAVPVQQMEQVIIALAPLVKPGATVVDIASVKMLPSRWLAEHMPSNVHIVPLHPLFGPQSVARDGLAGRQLVICPVRGEQHLKVAALGEELGLRIQITTAEEHDREMAYVQALTHLVGRTLSSMNIPDEMLKTQSYQHLLDLCDLLKRDSFALFSAIQTLNPHAEEITQTFVSRASELLAQAHQPQR